MGKLSILIPCSNAAVIIRPCLEGVKWADEILICDSFSKDGTLAICRLYTDRIIQHAYINSATQKNWAIPQCCHEWILIVDTDEIVTKELKDEILSVIHANGSGCDSFRVPRRNFVYGQWMRYGGHYPDYQVRLFRKGRARYQEREVHAHMVVDGQVGTLKNAFLHNGFKDVSTWFIKNERYLRYECTEYRKTGKHWTPFRMLAYPLATFCITYFVKKGFLDGWRGFLMAVLTSFCHFMIYLKLWEMLQSERPR